MKHYRSRLSFWGQVFFALVAVFLAYVLFAAGHPVVALVLLTLFSAATVRSPQFAGCNAVTLSVPEIISDVLKAFKLETPELFGLNGFARDFSSKTAVLGDKITANLSHVPVIAEYDKDDGGFRHGAQDVTTLIEDVPVTLNQLRHVPVKVAYLTQMCTKGVDLYKAAITNVGFALGKYVVDQVLQQCAAGTTNLLHLLAPITNVDTFDGSIRAQCNSQHMAASGRWAYINSDMAEALGNDDRTRSKLFFDERNSNEGFRRWVNLGGFSWVKEYTDITLAGNQILGICGDSRLACVAVRKIQDITSTAKALGIRQVMSFESLRDGESGLELCGIGWQEGGTGDVFVSAAILFGVAAGNQGGAPGSITDNAGLKLISL